MTTSATKLPGFRRMPRMRFLGQASAPGYVQHGYHDVVQVGADGVALVIMQDSDGDYQVGRLDEDSEPVWSDPATGGCCLALLGIGVEACRLTTRDLYVVRFPFGHEFLSEDASFKGASLGEACAAVAIAINGWPGGMS